MNFINQLNRRFSQPDIIQLSLLFFTIIFFAFLISWPASSTQANDSFFAVSQARLLCLLLLALGFGSVFSLKPLEKQKLTGVAILALCLFSMPFEVASYSMSFPSVPLYWTLLLSFIDTLAFFGLGCLLGHFLSWSRLRILLPLAVPSLLTAFVAIDIFLGVAIFNPLTALTKVSLPHLFLMTGCASLCLIYFFSRRKTLPDDKTQ